MKKFSKFMLLILDILIINISIFIALYIRFDGNIFEPAAQVYFNMYFEYFWLITLIKITTLYFFKIYSPIWKYASIEELLLIVKGTGMAALVFMAISVILKIRFPRSLYILAFGLDTAFIGTSRLSTRFLGMMKSSNNKTKLSSKRVLLIGAGEAGSIVARELKTNPKLRSNPVAFIDDNTVKNGKTISGIQVVGTRKDLTSAVKKYNVDQIVIAIPSAPKTTIRELIEICSETRCEIKILPALYELRDGHIDINSIRNIEISDLLGREEIVLDFTRMRDHFSNKTVMVTGGGGSIGSELCRQVASLGPRKLIILDIYENNAFFIENELKEKYKDMEIIVVIASVRDRNRIFKVVESEKPNVIFHAAAHKHVPLMESNPSEAIKNNVFGSLNVIEAAKKYKVEKFVLISTDKAVNPTNIMGASKRVTEMIVQAHKNCHTTTFTAVRFGNVLGSNGSVVPIFKGQIEKGGPITITHPDIIRYFMTIQEASRLVIQASTFAKSGDVFVLDMGDPVKIVDLAENMIKLAGLKPYDDIEIVFTGLRPGEKMYEELVINEVNTIKTENNKIYIEKLEHISESFIEEMINELGDVFEDEDLINLTLRKYVRNYKTIS